MKGHYSDATNAVRTVRDMAGIKVVRGPRLATQIRRGVRAIGLDDRQIKRMLGHGVAGGSVAEIDTGLERRPSQRKHR